MTIILLILKIIGFVLLAMLGLFLLAIVAILFVPVRYRITGEVREAVSVRIRVNWLLHILSWRADSKDKEFVQKLRIFGFFFKKREKPVKIRKEKKPRKARNTKKNKTKADTVPKSIRQPEISKVPDSESVQEPEIPEAPGSEPASEPDALPQKPTQPSRLQKIKHFPGMIKSKWGTIKEKTKALKERTKHIQETLSQIWEEFQDEENRNAAKRVFLELKTLLQHFLPGKIKVDAFFSAGDPAKTGQVLGLAAMLPFIYQYQIHLYPDFEAEAFYVNGSFDIRGRVRGIHVLILVIRLIKDKNIRKLIQRYRNP